MNARFFNPDEVTFTLTAEEEDLHAPDEHFDLGQEYLDTIRKRLEKGDIWAWAQVKITASFGGLTGNAYIGGCNYKDEKDFRQNSGYFKDLLEDAVRELLKEIKYEGWDVEATEDGIAAVIAKEIR